MTVDRKDVSADSGFRPPAAFRRLWLMAYWAFIFFLTHWPNVKDFPGSGWLPESFDLVVHGCMYAGWTAAWWWVLAAKGIPMGKPAAGWLLAGGAAYGVFDELSQAIVGRDPNVFDFTADMAGVTAVLLLAAWWSRRRPRVR